MVTRRYALAVEPIAPELDCVSDAARFLAVTMVDTKFTAITIGVDGASGFAIGVSAIVRVHQFSSS
jgi:hypothetical protein